MHFRGDAPRAKELSKNLFLTSSTFEPGGGQYPDRLVIARFDYYVPLPCHSPSWPTGDPWMIDHALAWCVVQLTSSYAGL